MARRIRVPGLIDVYMVDDSAAMRKLNADPRVSRRLVESRLPGNEAIRRRIQSELRVGDQLLPVFTAREQEGRARRQQELKASFSEQAARGLEGQQQDLERLGRHVAGLEPGLEVGVVVQQIVGRCFDPSYQATRESYEAARTIDQWARANPLAAVRLRAGGRLRQARELLWSLARRDPHCIHGTAIAMHNIVASVEELRRAVQSGIRPLSDPEAPARLLKGPESLLRCCTSEVPVEGSRRPLRRGTLVIFQLQKIREKEKDRGLAFAKGEWNECPAAGLVETMMSLVWQKAAGAAGQKPAAQRQGGGA